MGEQDDKVFLKRFSGIIAGLVIVTILIIIIAVGYEKDNSEDNPSKAILAEERVAPVAGVRTDAPKTIAGPVTVEVADNVELQSPQDPVNEEIAEESTAPAESQDTASEAGIDGAALYASACSACHMAGVAGAPVPGTDGMAERAAKGLDAVVEAAIVGVGPIMQPKGGRTDLSDEEIRAIVEYMLEQ